LDINISKNYFSTNTGNWIRYLKSGPLPSFFSENFSFYKNDVNCGLDFLEGIFSYDKTKLSNANFEFFDLNFIEKK
jgi:hypothetical protein